MATFFSPSALLKHFQEYIPRLSDKFSDNAIVSAEIIAGTPQVLRVNDVAHGLIVGKSVSFIDGKIDNPITAVQKFSDPSGDILRFTVTNPHDLTLDYNNEIELFGFTDTNLNGVFTITGVPSRLTFEIEYDTLPTLNGNEVLREFWEIGINGIFLVSTVIDVDNYEVLLTDKPFFTPGPVPILKRAKGLRMGVSVDAERAHSIYTKEDDPDSLWLYVIMGDSSASKDKNLKSDAVQANTAQNAARILMINTFSILVIFPTDKQLAGSDASDQAWDEILKLMLAVGAGIKFDDFGNTNYRSALIDHGSAIYNNATYSHSYTFEYNYEVTNEESFLTQFIESRAFRDNAISLSEPSTGSNLNLDEEST